MINYSQKYDAKRQKLESRITGLSLTLEFANSIRTVQTHFSACQGRRTVGQWDIHFPGGVLPIFG